MAEHIIEEAKRCLHCSKAYCVEACPIQTPIPQMIDELLNNGVSEAGNMLLANNPMALVCSLVCEYEKMCEGNCVWSGKGVPIHISSIEHYIADTCFEKMQIICSEKNGHNIAIIGSGPAGLMVAFALTAKGYSVTIFEGKDQIGGVLRYGIPEFRLPKRILERYRIYFEMDTKLFLRQQGFGIHKN